jgi:hypothetical protein
MWEIGNGIYYKFSDLANWAALDTLLYSSWTDYCVLIIMVLPYMTNREA